MMNNNVKTAMVGTPCQILAATKINEYSDEISLNNYQKETLSYWCSLNNIDFEKFIS